MKSLLGLAVTHSARKSDSRPAMKTRTTIFCQILSTEGVVGLAALLLALAVALVPAIRAERTMPVFLRSWLVAGIGACLVTWLTGHPQLVPEAAFAFWLMLGVLAALRPPPAPRAWRTAVVFTAALVFGDCAVSSRARDSTGGLRPHRGWVVALATRDRRASLSRGWHFVRALSARRRRSVELPLRRAPGAPDPLVVTIS